jgi:sterol desaturase/sphingolipid hydroxylase (fatty acid hydroxylase superfamily)
MYTLLKSEVGSFPEAHFPQGIDLDAEDHKARRRLYPVTFVYSVQLTALLALAARSHKLLAALAFMAVAIAAWIPIEYWAHRYILHGAFPKRGLLGSALHYLFDASHSDHHARPWDGMYINGHVDTLWLALVVMPLSFLAPAHTAPVFLATVLACYAFEEWVHHATHFWNFRWSYFQYLRRRHLFHHSRHGVGLAYGVTSGIWDAVAGTRIPVRERRLLLPGRHTRRQAAPLEPAPEKNLAHGA